MTSGNLVQDSRNLQWYRMGQNNRLGQRCSCDEKVQKENKPASSGGVHAMQAARESKPASSRGVIIIIIIISLKNSAAMDT
jgi:hypothetical protein